jgi:hypothetical protein
MRGVLAVVLVPGDLGERCVAGLCGGAVAELLTAAP